MGYCALLEEERIFKLMKVLFVSSGNSKYGIVPFIKSQGESLIANGVKLEYFTIKGKGIIGYLKSVFPLRKTITSKKYDIIHAHYSLTAFIASFSLFFLKIPLIVSLMGSDVNSNYFEKILIKLFNSLFWNSVVVKSEDMKNKIKLKDAEIIPNGIDFSIFKPLNQLEARDKVGFDKNKKQVLWLADPNRYVKNIDLAKKAFSLVKENSCELKIVHGIRHDEIPIYLNACDLLLLTSRWEGSPNVIKEAMACNLPIVTTNVGDVELIINYTEGCFVVDQNVNEMALAIRECIAFNDRTKGRGKVKWLDSNLIAKKLINIYKDTLKEMR